jgi:LysR family transcriptional regulator, hydrogen peroxide-inducible genes activator
MWKLHWGVRRIRSKRDAMDIHHIRYFLAVCDTLNFTRAADKCNVTQPALSRAVQQLEEELGGLLFRREKSLTTLTELGTMMRPRLRKVVDELGDMRREVEKFLTLEDAHITLGVLRSVGPTRLTGFLSSFKLTYPGIKIRLVEGMPDDFNQRLESGEIDVAIMARSEGFPERFDLRPLYRERFLLAFAADHRFAQMDEIPLDEVDGENYLRRLTCEFRGYLAGLIKDHHCALNVCFQSDREDWILNMVAGGLGICFIPEFSALVPGINVRPVVDPEIWREVCLVTMAGRRLSPALLSFTKAVKDYPWPTSRYVKEPSAA